MAIVDARNMLIRATEGGYAVGAFNVTSLVQMKAVVDTAVELDAPLIIQTSVTPAKFFGLKVLANLYRTLAEDAPIPICLHLDHCDDVDMCKAAADTGYTNIMIDASAHPFDENIRQTREICEYCHGIGHISVEGELGTVSGVEDQVAVAEDEAQLCSPEQAVEFVSKTGVDLFAPAIGTAHGVYKTDNPKIDFDRLDRVRQLLNDTEAGIRAPLIIHGGTGLKPETVKRLIGLGGAKYNVSTDLKHATIDSAWEYLGEHRSDYNPGKMDKAVREAVMARIRYWIELLGCAGKAAHACSQPERAAATSGA